IAEIAKKHISPKMGVVTSIAVIFILIITMAGLGIPVVNSLYKSPWGYLHRWLYYSNCNAGRFIPEIPETW
ncbi:carbon starvation CstA family protein, partial [Weissella cibaria]|uniref:carbon starvation CstA family protein n=1 Tax=Weissella cibaria TaxID=137591 RepID=UPI0019D586F7